MKAQMLDPTCSSGIRPLTFQLIGQTLKIGKQSSTADAKQVFDSSPAILAVSPFAMERQLYSLATHGATS